MGCDPRRPNSQTAPLVNGFLKKWLMVSVSPASVAIAADVSAGPPMLIHILWSIDHVISAGKNLDQDP